MLKKGNAAEWIFTLIKNPKQNRDKSCQNVCVKALDVPLRWPTQHGQHGMARTTGLGTLLHSSNILVYSMKCENMATCHTLRWFSSVTDNKWTSPLENNVTHISRFQWSFSNSSVHWAIQTPSTLQLGCIVWFVVSQRVTRIQLYKLWPNVLQRDDLPKNLICVFTSPRHVMT